MANGLFSMPTPEAIRLGARRDAMEQARLFAQAPPGRGFVQAASQAGGLFGEALGRAAGGKAPGEDLAEKMQGIQANVSKMVEENDIDITSPQGFVQMAQITADVANKEGLTQVAQQASLQALEVQKQFQQTGLDAPRTRSVVKDGFKIWQEWQPMEGEWREVGRTSVFEQGGSEFERLMAKRNREGLNAKEEKRLNVLAGTGMRAGEEARLNMAGEKMSMKEMNDIRDEYLKGSEHARTISTNIDGAIAAMETGDTALSDTLLAQVMSQVQDTDVRAFQMYGEFNKPFGNLAERISGQISRFVQGRRTPAEREVIKNTLMHFKTNYADKMKADMRNMYRNMARNRGADPFQVVPPTSPEDIRDYPGIDTEEKMRLLKVFFPNSF